MKIYSLNTGSSGICMKDSLLNSLKVSKETILLSNYKLDIFRNTGIMLLDLNILRNNNFTKFCIQGNSIKA